MHRLAISAALNALEQRGRGDAKRRRRDRQASSCVAVTGPGFPCEASVAFTLKLFVPGMVGVPEITPALLNERPEGRVEPLAKAQVSEPAPPVACNVAA